MKTYIIEIDEKQLATEPEQVFRSIKGVKSVKESTDQKELKPLTDEDWIKPGRPATDEEWEQMIVECEKEEGGYTVDEARELILKEIETWRAESQK